MICPTCDEERKESDFLKSVECYKCVYQKKLKNIGHVESGKICKICGNDCGIKRWTYCSEECAHEGKSIQNRNYWTVKMKNSCSYISTETFNNKY